MSIRPLLSGNPYAANTLRPNQDGPSAIAVTRPESRPLHLWFVGFATLIVVAMLASKASAQGKFAYDSIDLHPALKDEKRVNQVHAVTKQYANSGQGNVASVNGYFGFYVPAKMTAPDGVKYISELTNEAAMLVGRAERANRTAVVQNLNRYIFDGMKKVAEGNHHPAARISAISMLSRLNSKPANLQTKTPPVPLKNVLPILVTLYQDENNVDGIRAAALHGIHRHTQYGFPQMSPQERDTIRQLASDLLDAPSPATRPEKAHAYLQRFAVDILGALKPNDDKQLATRLVSVSTKDENPNLIAMYAAEQLASMSEDLEGQVDEPEELLKSWTKRILLAYESDLDRINAMERPRSRVVQPPIPESFLDAPKKKKSPTNQGMGGLGGMMGGMGGMMEGMEGAGMEDEGMGGMGGMGDLMGDMLGGMGGIGATSSAKPQPPEVRASRRKLNALFQQVHLAVSGKPEVGMPTTPGGLLAAVSDDQKPAIQSWLEKMETIVNDLNDKTIDKREKWVEKLTEQIDVLKEMVGNDQAADLGLPDDLAPQDPSDQIGG